MQLLDTQLPAWQDSNFNGRHRYTLRAQEVSETSRSVRSSAADRCRRQLQSMLTLDLKLLWAVLCAAVWSQTSLCA